VRLVDGAREGEASRAGGRDDDPPKGDSGSVARGALPGLERIAARPTPQGVLCFRMAIAAFASAPELLGEREGGVDVTTLL